MRELIAQCYAGIFLRDQQASTTVELLGVFPYFAIPQVVFFCFQSEENMVIFA
jgi:hypothetical protein